MRRQSVEQVDEMAEDRARVSLVVTGIVQGVFFRAATAKQAQALGVTGWVTNRPDGSVEVLAEGPRSALAELVRWCRHGPPSARVQDLSVLWGGYTGEFAEFVISR